MVHVPLYCHKIPQNMYHGNVKNTTYLIPWCLGMLNIWYMGQYLISQWYSGMVFVPL